MNNHRMRLAAFGFLAGLVVWAVRCTEPLTPPLTLVTYQLKADSLTAVYRPSPRDCIVLRWLPPTDVDFYLLYRWQEGVADSVVRLVDGDADSTSDILDVSRRNYTYAIAACKLDGDNLSVGPLSNKVTIAGGLGIRFSINNGATNAASDTVMLNLSDSRGFLRNVRFTQVVQRFAFLGTDTTHNLSTLDIARFTSADIAALGTKYNTASKVLESNVQVGMRPLFGAADSRNQPARSTLISGVNRSAGTPFDTSFQWLLQLGKEDKVVYAEVRTSSIPFFGFIVDTLMYSLPIAPFRMRMRLENERLTYYPDADIVKERWDGPSDATMVYYHEEGSQNLQAWDRYVIMNNEVSFTVGIDIDSSFDRSFKYWLVFGGPKNALYQASADAVWYETVRRDGRLTGLGPFHNEDEIYRYSLDTLTVEGRENLAQIKVIKNNWRYPFVDYESTVSGTPGENYRTLTALTDGEMTTSGKNAFFVAFEFTGRVFKEKRYIMTLTRDDLYSESKKLESGLNREVFFETYYDQYPPAILMKSPGEPGAIVNGDTVTGSFDYALGGASVTEGGKARISEIKLVVAQMPAVGRRMSNGSVWTDTSWNFEKWTSSNMSIVQMPISLQDMYDSRVTVLEYPRVSPLRVNTDVVWRDIDPSTWPSGQYLVGIVTGDEFGNEGLAPMNFSFSPKVRTNPFMINVLTGR